MSGREPFDLDVVYQRAARAVRGKPEDSVRRVIGQDESECCHAFLPRSRRERGACVEMPLGPRDREKVLSRLVGRVGKEVFEFDRITLAWNQPQAFRQFCANNPLLR